MAKGKGAGVSRHKGKEDPVTLLRREVAMLRKYLAWSERNLSTAARDTEWHEDIVMLLDGYNPGIFRLTKIMMKFY